MNHEALLQKLRDESAIADSLSARAREMLTTVIRQGHAAGLTQRELAAAVGRSQPEISRLLRFRSNTPLGRRVSAQRVELIKAISQVGGRNARVFGSVARGEDTEDSDLDILVDFTVDISLFELSRLELKLGHILGTEVDVTPADALRQNLLSRALSEAVPL